eukprot:SAG31_NODE_8215_length_1494_cov_3.767025_1_plen_413_part_10
MPTHRQHLAGAVVACFAATASAVHLAGPMNDAMQACGVANCPAFMAHMSSAGDIQGTGLPLSSFLAPPFNAVPFIYNMEYALDVMGYAGTADSPRTPGEFLYRATPNSVDAPVPQDLTAGGADATDISGDFACMCENCGAMVEAIFQPIGRAVCGELGFPLPCQAEFDTCQAATPDGRPDGYTGSAAGLDLVYPVLYPPIDADGNWLSQSDPCQPEATFGAYKAAYDLETQCAAGEKALGVTGEDTAADADSDTAALTLAKCVAQSRIDVYADPVYSADLACSAVDIGGADCGEVFPADACVPDCTADGVPDPCVVPDCTAVETPYAGCTAQDCTAVDTPYAGCTVPDCIWSVDDPYYGCTVSECTADDTPYAGCTVPDCIWSIDDPYYGCTVAECTDVDTPYAGCLWRHRQP